MQADREPNGLEPEGRGQPEADRAAPGHAREPTAEEALASAEDMIREVSRTGDRETAAWAEKAHEQMQQIRRDWAELSRRAAQPGERGMKEAAQSISKGMEEIESSLQKVADTVDQRTRSEVQDALANARDALRKMQQELGRAGVDEDDSEHREGEAQGPPLDVEGGGLQEGTELAEFSSSSHEPLIRGRSSAARVEAKGDES